MQVRRWVAVVLGAIAATSSGAPAVASLATLNLSVHSGRPGTRVAVTGDSFATPRAGTDLTPTPVVIHWRSQDGPVLAEATPDRFGSISASFTVPEAGPGFSMIVATQRVLRSVPGAPADQAPGLFDEPGTPARIAFEVSGPQQAVALASAAPPGSESGDFDSTVWIVLIASFGAVAVSMFGGGLIALVHQSRQSKLPTKARWVPPGW